MEIYFRKLGYLAFGLLLAVFAYGLVIAYKKMNTPVIEIRELPLPLPITVEPSKPVVTAPAKSDKPLCLTWENRVVKGTSLKVCTQWAE